MNWGRIISIGGLTFCTTLVATGFQAEASILNAALLAFIALFTEVKIESEPITKVQKKLMTAMIL